ncbi:MAG: hypothetical protein N4A31_04450 [Rickettsiales bacterium]|jgi:hypothetical protein|nr:hypothetical protein [Rickettsiales bacterium]
MYSEIKVPYGYAIVVFSNLLSSNHELNEWVKHQASFFQEVMNRVEPSFSHVYTVPTESIVFSFNPNHFPNYEEFTSYPEIDYGAVSSNSLSSLYYLLGNTWNGFFMPNAQENVSPHLSLFDVIPVHHGF